MSNHKAWSRKQEKLYFRDLMAELYYEKPVILAEVNFVIYEIEINTTDGVYSYIGQTGNLERRLRQHGEHFNILQANVLESASDRPEALRKEKDCIMYRSDERLLNKTHNIFYAEGTREHILVSLNKHFIDK